ncbi:HNH endonuclease [Ochrobactrum tritici]|uniref:HNH endonuclease n=1 Tax=Brucella tritici TaxID=94626 RepID=A0A7X6FQJ3_9HYPH|nr:HNH endonuclease [Brucella tritici]
MCPSRQESALKKQGGKCIYCLDPLTVKQVTREHIKPRSAGGLDSKDNIAAACAPCNRLKGSTPYGKFMRLISEPRSGEPIKYRLVWFSRQLNKRIALMEKRVMRAVGRKE